MNKKKRKHILNKIYGDNVNDNKHTVEIVVYTETHCIDKIIHNHVTIDEYYKMLRTINDRADINVLRYWYNYENDIFYIDVYVTGGNKNETSK